MTSPTRARTPPRAGGEHRGRRRAQRAGRRTGPAAHAGRAGQSGARLALANKESLVAGGPLVLKAAQPGQIVPVDSEHSALAQCLRGGTADEVAKIVLTASGGPFRGWSAADARARHPRAGRRASDLVDGSDEHAELGVAGQQGPGADRNPPAVRHPLRPHRGRRAPAVDRPLDGHVHRRLDDRPGQPARHETADRARAGLARPGPRRGPGMRLPHRLDLGVRAARRRTSSRPSSWRGRPASGAAA